MKTALKKYLDLSESEIIKIWNDAIFIFDTNVLLNLYRYTENTRNALLKSIKDLGIQPFLPYQVAFEFIKDRPKVIFDTIDRYDTLTKNTTKFLNDIKDTLRLPSNDESLSILEKYIQDWIIKRKEADLKVTTPSNDEILTILLDLFNNKVGSKQSKQILDNIYKEGKERYEKDIPPGFKDKSKLQVGDNSAFSDLVIWKEMIEISKIKNKDIIFITNDQKDDWWNIIKGKSLGPRLELRSEFFEETGRLFLIYTIESFLDYMPNSKGLITQAVIDEVKKSYISDQIQDNNFSDIKINNLINGINKRKKVIAHLEDKYNETLDEKLLEQIYNTRKNLIKKEKELNYYNINNKNTF
jgi:hypothetical protein